MQVAKPVLHPTPPRAVPVRGVFYWADLSDSARAPLWGVCRGYDGPFATIILAYFNGRWAGSVADPFVERRPFVIVVAHKDRVKTAVITRERCYGVNADLLFDPFRHGTS